MVIGVLASVRCPALLGRLLGALCVALLVTVTAVRAVAQDAGTAAEATGVSPERALRGNILTVTGRGFTGGERLRLCFAPVRANDECTPQPTLRLATTPTSVAAVLLTDTPLTRYRVEIEIAGKWQAVGDVHVVPSEVVVTNVAPPIPFLSKDGTFSLTLFGSGFSILPDENILVFDDMPALQPCPLRGCGEGGTALSERRVIATVGPLQREITYRGIPESYHGIHQIRVAVGNVMISAPQRVTFAQVEEGTPLLIALAVVALLAGLLYLGLRQRLRQTAAGKLSIAGALFLDEERLAYSLSKLQFYAWTFASLLAYLYLSAARSLVQGKLELSAVPEGLPGVLLAAVGTTVLATTISGVKGAQGAGEFRPRFADFFTHGGVVAPERLQFFLWTVIGVLSFLTVTLLHSPDEIQDLPAIPEGFLTLSGISAAGYLGGKLARKPGPRITAVTPFASGTRAAGAPFEGLLVEGERLSTAAGSSLLIGSKETAQEPVGVDIKDPVPQSDTREPGLVRRMALISRTPAPDWLQPGKGRFYLTIVNPDGQKHVWPYELPTS